MKRNDLLPVRSALLRDVIAIVITRKTARRRRRRRTRRTRRTRKATARTRS